MLLIRLRIWHEGKLKLTKMADKEIAVPEMETLILQNIQITENDLKALAKKKTRAGR